MNRLLDTFDEWARSHGRDADVGPPERFEPTRVAGVVAARARPHERRDPLHRLGDRVSPGLQLARRAGARSQGPPAARRRRGRRAGTLCHRPACPPAAQVDLHPRRRRRRARHRRSPGGISVEVGVAGSSDLAAPGERRDVLARPERQRRDRLGRLPARRGDHAAAVADEQVPHVVRAMEPIDDRGPRVVAHPARAEQVHRLRLRLNRLGPRLERAGRLRDLASPARSGTRAFFRSSG